MLGPTAGRCVRGKTSAAATPAGGAPLKFIESSTISDELAAVRSKRSIMRGDNIPAMHWPQEQPMAWELRVPSVRRRACGRGGVGLRGWQSRWREQ